MITTTLNRIRAHNPCHDGWKTLLTGLGKTQADDEPLPFAKIVEINGFDDALWCCQVEPQYEKEWRLFAVWCARQVQHLMTDQRSIAALNAADRYVNGEITKKELNAARDAALNARDWHVINLSTGFFARAAALNAARFVGWGAALCAARDAACEAACEAVDAARDAAWKAACKAVDAERDAAWKAAWDAAYDAARFAQTKEFLRIVTETEARSE